MSKDMIVHIFASVQGLEKCVLHSRKMLAEQKHQPLIVHSSITEQERVLKQMRRAANRLQLELVSEDWVSAVRSLNIFYGLCTMARPEILSTFSSLANRQVCLQLSDHGATCH